MSLTATGAASEQINNENEIAIARTKSGNTVMP